MDLLAQTLIAWIAVQTGRDLTGIDPPRILPLTPQELTLEYYSDAPDAIPASGIDDRVLALYDAQTPGGVIRILHPSDLPMAEAFDDPTDNPIWREVLLHELVHHVQWQTHEADAWTCRAQGEREAYLLGGRYLAERHVTDPLPNRAFWAHAYSRC